MKCTVGIHNKKVQWPLDIQEFKQAKSRFSINDLKKIYKLIKSPIDILQKKFRIQSKYLISKLFSHFLLPNSNTALEPTIKDNILSSTICALVSRLF